MSASNQLKNIIHQYKSLVTPMSLVKGIALAATTGIFVISSQNWSGVFYQFIITGSAGLAASLSTMTFFAVQALEILPEVATHGHDNVETLSSRALLAQRDPLTKSYLERDAYEEFKVDETSLIMQKAIQAAAFAIDLIVNWYAWASPISGFGLLWRTQAITALTINWFGLIMVIITTFGIPFLLLRALKEAKRSNFHLKEPTPKTNTART